MYAGQIIEVASSQQFFSAPAHPYAQALLRSLPEAGQKGQALESIGGVVPPLWLAFTGCRFAPRCNRRQARCDGEAPSLLQGSAPTSQVRCWFPGPGVAATPVQPALALPPQHPPVPALHAPLLEVQGLNVHFAIRTPGLLPRKAEFHAVRGLSFTLQRGRTLALVGESGCGKTTTGKAIAQLLRRQARCTGQALLNGHDLFALQGAALLAARRHIQVVFQDPFASLNPRMRVSQILGEGLHALHPELEAGESTARLARLLDQVGLRADAMQRYPHEFSGGQRQRIAIARALAVQPKLIICDEPTSALDVSVQAQILNLLRQLQAETGVAFLFITHNIGVVEYLADEVAVMRQGAIVEQGQARPLLLAPQAAYTRSLLAAVPRIRA
jgi:peptide/nickel transport system ATP-binding protein